MQNAEDRRQLMDRYGGEPSGPIIAVLKCVAGILALIAIAAVPWLLLTPDAGVKATHPPAASVIKAFPNSLAESRRIFEERRRRHEARVQDGTPAKKGRVAEAQATESPDDK